MKWSEKGATIDPMRQDQVPVYHRIAVAQISFNPAYVDTAGMSDVHEPVPGDQFHGLYRVADIPEIATARSSIAQRYLRHISEKIRSLAEFASTQDVELVVFPEYSIPADALDLCSDLASRLHLAIVAGSHTVTQTAIERYRRLRIETGTGGRVLGRAACPVFVGDGKAVLFEKTTRSKWESDMVPGIQISPVTAKLRGGTIRLQVLICIDALQDPSPGGRRQFRDSIPTLLAVPALSPDASLFRHKGALVLASGRCVVLANAAEYGGTTIFARAERCRSWFATNDGTEPLPKGSEALVVADIDLANQYDVRQYTGESFPVRNVQIYPLLYPDHSEVCRRYWAFQKLVHSGNAPMHELRTSAGAFTRADPREFPFLLRDKLKHFLDNVDGAGLADMASWKTWIHAAVVSSTETTAALRAQSCVSAMDVVSQRAVLNRNPSRVSQLTDTYAFLAKSYCNLTAELPTSGGPHKSTESPLPSDRTTVFEPPFFDRELQLDAIRKSIEAPDRPCHIIAGMRGIGKSSLAKEVFKKVILPTWKRVWIQVTEGMSLPRLLAEIAYRLELEVPDDLPNEEVSQTDVTQNVLLYISQTPRLAIGLADIQHLLGPDRDFADPATRVLLERLIRAACDKKNKLIFTTTQVPQWGGDVVHLIETTHLGGMDDKSAERLFSFWLRFESEDLNSRTLAYPEKALGLIRGHPLALKLAAKMWAEHPQSEAAADIALFKRIRETMVAYVLDQVHLAPHEEEFLRFASVFRVPVKREAFVRWKGDQAVALLESLLGQSLLEVESETYLLHPLVRDHYYAIAGIEELRPLHAIAGQYFLDQFKDARTARLSVDPEIVSEAVHHLLCAGEREKVKELGQYRHELRPVARMHYYKRSYDLALKEYRLLIELDPDDCDAHFHLALIYASDDRWEDAEAHFGRASRLKPGAHWILQGYAHALLRKRRELPRVELLLKQAEGLDQFDSFTLLDLGVLFARTGRDSEAETYFQRAVDADSENTRALYAYAKFLRDAGRLEEALPMAVAALESKPTDSRNKTLVRELRRRVREAQPAP